MTIIQQPGDVATGGDTWHAAQTDASITATSVTMKVGAGDGRLAPGRRRRGGRQRGGGACDPKAATAEVGATPSPAAAEGRMSQVQVVDDPLLAEQDALIRAEQEMRLARHAQLQACRVKSPVFTVTMDALERCYRMQPILKEPPCASLVGPKGCGKTTIAESFLARHPPIKSDHGIERPVVYCIVPPAATYSMLVSELLREMGDPRCYKGTITARTGRLREAFKRCKTRVLILDEINHFVYAKDQDVLRDGADWLKNMIKHPDTKLSVILVGLEDEFTAFVEANTGQLAHFFPDSHRFAPYTWGPKVRDQDQDLYIFLEQLEDLLPFDRRGYLANPDMAWRIYCASHGTLRYIMKLIRRAGEIAIDAGMSQPDRQALAQAFDKELAGKRRHVPNPFVGEKRPTLKAAPQDTDDGDDNDAPRPRVSQGGLGRHGRRSRAPRKETVQSILPKRGP